MASWWWRTKPRSIIKTVQWYKEFGCLEGKNWDEKDNNFVSKKNGKSVNTIRRTYIYNAHKEDLLSSLTFKQFLSGVYDAKEVESTGRNDKTSFEFFGFGYVGNDGIIHSTKVGELISKEVFDNEDFLKQLLKLHFPNKISNKKDLDEKDGIFPMQILLKAINKFTYLNRSELVLLFGCVKNSQISIMYKAIESFRIQYKALPKKNNISDVRNLCGKVYEEYYGQVDNKIASFYDYAEAFTRSLVYTGLFKTTGRSISTKIKVNEFSMMKFKMLLEKYEFQNILFLSKKEYMDWYGNPNATILPWDNSIERKILVKDKIDYLKNINLNSKVFEKNISAVKEEITNKVNETEKSLKVVNNDNSIKVVEKDLVNYITSLNEKIYIESTATTFKSRKEILEKYDDILANDDMSALWLEVNTWKSLLAMNGKKNVKRNFAIEEDLTPKSFAPGVGNTPDMEVYYKDYIILPEVSLMTGVRQWEHEASSVIDHVLSFINCYKDKNVFGLFISSSINIRTNWQFFILNKESWLEKPVPVIPLTIKQYCNIIKFMYKQNLDIYNFISLIKSIHEVSLKVENYNEWNSRSNDIIEKWKLKNRKVCA